LESLISSLNGEWNDLQRRRNVILPVIVNNLKTNTAEITRLSSRAGCLDPAYQEASSICLTHLGADVEEAGTDAENQAPVAGGERGAPLLPESAQGQSSATEAAEAEAPPAEAPSNRKSAASIQAAPSGELSEEFFEGLPVSVRGRVAFGVVREAYLLIERLVVARNCRFVAGAPLEPVPLAELHAAGAKVLGRSGEQVLSSLRSLKLITFSAKRGALLTRPITKKERQAARKLPTALPR